MSSSTREHPVPLTWEELTTFASTLGTLLPARDVFHVDLMIRTVAPDLAEEAAEAATPEAAHGATELAEGLWTIRDAVLASNWTEADGLWTEWRAKAEASDTLMR